MYPISALLVFTLIVLYWLRFEIWPDGARLWRTLLLIAALILLPAAGIFADREAVRGEVPVFVAIAADVSLSMDAAPDPRAAPGTGTRLQRAQRVLLPVLAHLEASGARVMAAVSTFTTRSQTLLTWEKGLPQVREVVEHVLSTDISAEHGSDLGAALEGALQLFEALPGDGEVVQKKQFLLVVSDGEQTESPLSVGTELAQLRDLGVRIISLHVGSAAIAEGLRVYDEEGHFVGFDRVGGQTYSVPDPASMRALAGSAPFTGTFLEVDDPRAVSSILGYMDVPHSDVTTGTPQVALISSLWVLSMVALIRLV